MPQFNVIVKAICKCGWLMENWDTALVCVNKNCAEYGKQFEANVELKEVPVESIL